jgi:hypothetical protein
MAENTQGAGREDRQGRPRGSEPQGYTGERVRQGRIVLNTPARRWTFIGGLIGFVVLAYVLAMLF